MNNTFDSIKLAAYAKVNLALYITGLREDGYHLIDSVMMPIDLYDIITIRKSSSGINVFCDEDIPTNATNTSYKAAQFIMDEYKEIEGVEIIIEKNIPSMAGLGGGSADAAATLIGMDVLFNLPKNKKLLFDIASKIGADVPFFMETGTKRVRGIGEVLDNVEQNAKLHLCLIKPDVSLSTPVVYKKYDSMCGGYSGDCQALINELKSKDIEKISKHIKNDLQMPATSIHPKINDEVAYLENKGALKAMMTGSGSCVFGVFADKQSAQKASNNYNGSGKSYYVCSVVNPVEVL
jgi:4-diphosphocytidyl-2-C-methyl-D-erythritol kinase